MGSPPPNQTAPGASSGRSAGSDVLIGKVNGIFGLKGEVRLYLYNPESDLLFDPKPVTLVAPDGRREARTLHARSGAGRRILGRLSGIHDPEAARARMDWEIYISESLLPPPEPGEFYHRDLLGAQVVSVSGTVVGTLFEIHENGPVDVWSVRNGPEISYVPALLESIVEVVPGEKVVITDQAAAAAAVL